MLKTVAEQGYHINREMYEQDVCSIAAPVFNQAQEPIGAIAVATPSSRFGEAPQRIIQAAVRDAATSASRALGAGPDELIV